MLTRTSRSPFLSVWPWSGTWGGTDHVPKALS
jgi:hypothetical protein